MSSQQFIQQLSKLSREELIEILLVQDPPRPHDVEYMCLVEQINRIEWVFANKLKHLNWPDGSPIEGRPLTTEELAYLVDEPFKVDENLTRAGLSVVDQRQLHVAKDPVLWAKHYLNANPRVYQILMLRWPGQRKVLRAGRRLGKAIHVDTPIPTPDGWKKMGELQEGDRVFDETGKPCNVTFATEYQYNRRCYKVSFSDGSHLIADADHQWTVDTKASRKARGRATNPQSGPITLTTQDMIDNLYVWAGDKYEVNYSIEVADPVAYEEKPLDLDPWLFGLWLADGTSSSGNITIGTEDQEEVFSRITDLGYEVHAVDAITFNIPGLYRQLNHLNILRKYRKKWGDGKSSDDNLVTKYIPRVYLQGSIPQREALLQGIMDGDGTADKKGTCELSFCNEQLAKDSHELILSLGYRATLRTEDATLNGKKVGLRYRISFTPWRPVFRLQRKLDRQVLRDAPSARQRCRYVVAIEETDSVPVKCISVDSPSSLYLAGQNFVATHNTFTMSVLLLHYCFTHNDGRCIVVAPMKSQVELIYKEIERLAGQSEIVIEAISRKVTSPQFVMEFANGSTIRFFTSGIRSGGKADVVRGQEAHIIVLDELDYMHNDDLESLYAMLQQTAAGQIRKIMIGASTPTGRREKFWEWCNSDRFKEFWFPSYVNPFFRKDDEDEFREAYTEMGYRHEVEADWGENTEGVYPRRYVDKAFACGGHLVDDNTDPIAVREASDWRYIADVQSARSFTVIGVDWDKYGAGTNIVVVEVCKQDYEDERFQGRARLVYREEVNKEEYTLTKAVDRVIELNRIFNPKHIYVDRGFGEVQVELLHRHGVDHPETGLRSKVKGVQFGESIEMRDPATKQIVKKELKPFMVDQLRQMLEREQIVFPASDEVLYLQLISYVVARVTGLGREVFEATGSSGDHIHDALILACYAIQENYNDLLKTKFATKAVAVSRENFSELFEISADPEIREQELDAAARVWGDSSAPIRVKRSFAVRMGSGNPSRPIRRKMF